MPLSKNNIFLLAFYLFIHILVLNLFYGSSDGLSIYWQENFNVKAMLVYLLSVTVTVIFYLGVSWIRSAYHRKK